MMALVGTVGRLSACTAYALEKSPNEMCHEMFDKHWSLLEATLTTLSPGRSLSSASRRSAMMRDIARAGYVGQCRTSVTQDDYTCVVGDHELRGFACQGMPHSILAMHPDPNVPKKAETKYFLFVQ